jgi:adenylate cyclase
MAKEIERKFLVKNFEQLKPGLGSPWLYQQGYIANNSSGVVRVRVMRWRNWHERAYITIKSSGTLERDEWDFELRDVDLAQEMLEAMCSDLITKQRYKLVHEATTWEIDEFLGDNAGLVLAEVELDSVDQLVLLPEWAGAEVTHDTRYYNNNLATNPYKNWK